MEKAHALGMLLQTLLSLQERHIIPAAEIEGVIKRVLSEIPNAVKVS